MAIVKTSSTKTLTQFHPVSADNFADMVTAANTFITGTLDTDNVNYYQNITLEWQQNGAIYNGVVRYSKYEIDTAWQPPTDDE